MNYKNGKEVLPPSLLKELQKYIEGELVYIPKKTSHRAAWGELSGSRLMIQSRNEDIYRCYMTGLSFAELERKFHLSVESIRKIVLKMRAAAVVQVECEGAVGRK
ncbi:CD3324 family protein [Paenibacillus beijingensis]|uniref:Mor transcription activator domain-containing protein n=1 Tax=Paenibacillus beijingensis TaxID=1126833 RepID=A0A0D5NQU8_9BACL|nr:hypothetical protein VN24_00315 [Paenibacillus beijingensis]